MFNTSLQGYQKTMNASDSPVQLSIRAVRSILLYCQDWDNKDLPYKQREQAVNAGQILCDALVSHMRNDLPEQEAALLLNIFTNTSIAMHDCLVDPSVSLIENEQALIKILDILNRRGK
jgi:hypothetical protein